MIHLHESELNAQIRDARLKRLVEAANEREDVWKVVPSENVVRRWFRDESVTMYRVYVREDCGWRPIPLNGGPHLMRRVPLEVVAAFFLGLLAAKRREDHGFREASSKGVPTHQAFEMRY
jgi:hypothetical protein